MTETNIHPIEKLNARIRAIVEKETLDKPIWTGGIIEGLQKPDYRNLYFRLYDGNYSIACIMREHVRNRLDFDPVDEMEVEVFGVIGVYDQKANFQIEVEKMRLVNPDLEGVFQSLEDELQQKGITGREKITLPTEINHISVITSKFSKARQDFESTYRGKQGKAYIDFCDVLVEGIYAPKQIAQTITRLNNEGATDVIVLTRGGGRHEMLATFDDILIAEAIYLSKIPVVTAIGHKTDKTFADRIADYPTITPTAAADLLAPAAPTPTHTPSITADLSASNAATVSSHSQSNTHIPTWIFIIGFILIIAAVIAVFVLFGGQ